MSVIGGFLLQWYNIVVKSPSIKSLRNNADSLCTLVAKKTHPNCILCGMETEVGHHFIHKIQSNSCRYYIPNLVGLCNRHHGAVHGFKGNLFNNKIRDYLGEEWYKGIVKKQAETVKTDRFFYLEAYERLNEYIQAV